MPYFMLAAVLLATPQEPVTGPEVIVVVGHGGEAEFKDQFAQWADRWKAAAKKGNARWHRVGPPTESDSDDRIILRELLAKATRDGEEPLWIVFIGHGTFDGRRAKFNLRGPDVAAQELSEWLDPFQRPVAIVNCASSSAPFINLLSAKGRIVVTATKSGYELNYARLGDYMSAALTDPAADLDKDDQISLLEAFLFASARTYEFYEQNGRLATEHGLIDDNGDSMGTPADWFRGVRAIKAAKDDAEVDGIQANQLHLIRSSEELKLTAESRARRDELERQIELLRARKAEIAEVDYYDQLKPLMVELAHIYRSAANNDEQTQRPPR